MQLEAGARIGESTQVQTPEDFLEEVAPEPQVRLDFAGRENSLRLGERGFDSPGGSRGRRVGLLRGVWGVLHAGDLWAGSAGFRSPGCLSFPPLPP